MREVLDNNEMFTVGDYYETLVKQGIFQSVEEADAYFADRVESEHTSDAVEAAE